MPLLAFGTIFFGYSILYYGITQVRGANWGLLDLMIPGKFDASIPTDGGDAAAHAAAVAPIVGPNAPGGGVAGAATGAASALGANPNAVAGGPGAGVTQLPSGVLA